MHGILKAAAALGLSMAMTAPARPEPGPHAVIRVAEELLRAYKEEDAEAFHRLLSSGLQAKYPVEGLRAILARCRALTYEIDRLSIPSWGARNFGFFGVYAELAVLEMILEIDDDEKIVHWVITDNVTAKSQECSVTKAE